MFGRGLPGLLAGLGAFSFVGFHWFGLPSQKVFVTFGPMVCFIPS